MIALVFLAACDDNVSHRGTAVVRDSGEVRIVENLRPIWQPGDEWRLGPDPTVVIGGGETEEDQLFRVGGAFRLSDGRIVVANGGTNEIRFYGSEGAFVSASGGEGEGPGEFRGISQLIALTGDTLLVRERWRRTWIGPEGQHVRDESFDAGVFASQPSLLTYDGQAFAVNVRERTGPPQMGLSTRFGTWVLLPSEGGAADTLGSVPEVELFTIRIGGRPARYPRPFGRMPYAPTTGARGIVFGHNTSFEMAVYSYDGQLVEIIRRHQGPTLVTSDHIAQFRTQFAEQFPPGARANAERWLDEVPFPDTFPALGRLIVDRQGNIWAQDFVFPGSTSTSWSLFNESGRWLGEVDLPDRFDPRDIGDNYVLGVWRDRDDVEYVRVYDLLKPGS